MSTSSPLFKHLSTWSTWLRSWVRQLLFSILPKPMVALCDNTICFHLVGILDWNLLPSELNYGGATQFLSIPTPPRPKWTWTKIDKNWHWIKKIRNVTCFCLFGRIHVKCCILRLYKNQVDAKGGHSTLFMVALYPNNSRKWTNSSHNEQNITSYFERSKYWTWWFKYIEITETTLNSHRAAFKSTNNT